jgi:hypothetical protein
MKKLRNFLLGFLGMAILCAIFGSIGATVWYSFTLFGPLCGVAAVAFWFCVATGLDEMERL